MRFPRLHCLALLFIFFSTVYASSDDIIQGEPACYADAIAPLLLSFDFDAVDREALDASRSDNATLLSENVTYIADDGTIYEVFHRVYTALTEGNLRYMAEDVYRFRPDREKLYVVLADTIQPSGERLSVRAEGIMHQTPQRDADLAIYSGQEELKLILPGVVVGATVHTIIVRETSTHRIPGEYTDYWTWSTNWQTSHKRVVLDMPAAVAEELDVFTLGSPVPERQEVEAAPDRVRWVWESESIPMWKREENGANMFQVGPLVYVTSLDSWDVFSAWYGGLVADRSTLPDELVRLSHEWVEGATTADEKLQALYTKAARDIRYTSIDFGHSGLQPQDAQTVWTNKYGDCKDKSNFLRLLLKEHGIDAYLTLINTEHSGLVDQRAVDYRHFDHAIVTVVKEDGSLVFCDPTIKYGWPGLMTPTLADRPALLIEPEQKSGRWVQTPASSADEIHYGFDMKLSASGEFTGWFQLDAVERYAAYFVSRFDTTDQVSLKQQVEKYVRYFFPKAELIDFELTPVSEFSRDFHLRAYVATTLPAAGDTGAMALNWPDIAWLLPQIGADRSIKRNAFLDRDSIKVDLKVTVPTSYQPSTLPRDFAIEALPFSASARWRFEPNIRQLSAELEHRLDDALVRPSKFSSLFQAVDATTTWLEEAITMQRYTDGDERLQSATPTSTSVQMSLMPTGDGQLALVDRLYPEGKNNVLRREALEQVMQWFPTDVTTRFESEIRLAWLDYGADQEEEALQSVRRLIREYGDQVSTQNIGWAYYLEACCLFALERKEEAREKFLALAEDETYSDFRRAWAYYYAGDSMRAEEPVLALDQYVKAFELTSGDELDMLIRITWHAMDAELYDAYVDFLNELIVQSPDLAEGVVTAVAEQATGWLDSPKYASLAPALYETVSRVSLEDVSIVDREDFSVLAAYVNSFASFKSIQVQVGEYLANGALDFWDPVIYMEEQRSAEELTEALNESVEANESDEATRLALVRLLHFEPTGEFGDWLWEAARYANWREKQSGVLPDDLLDTLLSLESQLPADSDAQLDLIFLRGLYWQRRGDLEQEFAVYEDLISRQLPAAWQDTLLARAGLNREHAEDYVRAEAIYRSALEFVETDWDMTDQLLRAALIQLERGEYEAAQQWVQDCLVVIEQSDETNTSLEVFQRWSTLIDAELLVALWTNWEQWWGEWEAIAEMYSITVASSGVHEVPVVDDWSEFGGDVGIAFGEDDDTALAELLRKLVHAARWDTLAITEFESMLSLFVTKVPEYSTEWDQLLVSVHQSIPAGVEPWQNHSLLQYLLVILRQEDQTAGAVAIDEYLAAGPEQDDTYWTIERIGALFVINSKQDIPRWVQMMELQVNTLEPDVAVYAANILAQLHRAAGDYEREAEALQSFLDQNPNFEHSLVQSLRTRQLELEKAQETTEAFNLQLQEWIVQSAPRWLEFMPELDISYYQTQRLTSVLQTGPIPGEDGFDQFQFALLAAQDPRLGVDECEDALMALLGTIFNTVETKEELLSLIRPMYQTDQFSVDVRLTALWNALSTAVFANDLIAVEAMLSDPIFDQFADRYKLVEPDCRLIAAVNPRDASSISAALDALVGSEVSHPMTDSMLQYLMSGLLRLGNVAVAEKYIKLISKSTLGKLPEINFRSMRLDYMRQIRAIRALEPLQQILSETYGPLLMSQGAVANYPELEPLSYYERTEFFDEATLMSLLKYEFEHDCYDHTDLSFWSDFIVLEISQSLDFDAHASRLDTIVFPSIDAVQDDATAIQLVFFLLGTMDIDDARSRALYFEACERLTSRGDLPECKELVKAINLGIKLRTGESLKIEHEVEGVSHPWVVGYSEGLVLDYYLSRGQDQLLKTFLNKQSSEVLLSRELILKSLIGFKRTGLDLEYEIAVEDALDLLNKNMAIAVAKPSRGLITQIFLMADVLGDDVLSLKWADTIRLKLPAPIRDDFEMHWAYYTKDWKRTAEYAAVIIKTHPRYYEYYYYLGMAQCESGELKSGRDNLQIFYDRAKDSSYIAAVAEILLD